MWAEACARLEEAERRHRRFFELLAPSAAPVWEPPANILSLGRELQVMVALPGARADQVVAQVTPSGLLIEATVAPPAFAPGVELPPGSYTLLEFRLDAGYLFLRLTGTTL